MSKIVPLLIFLIMAVFSAVVGQTSASYDITFTSIWNATDHTSVPGNAHWSKLVGATHKTANVFWQVDNLASTGIKNIAETGNNTVFNAEVTTAISGGEADQYINGASLGSATGDILIANLVVKKESPLLTLVSMIAPSPDWMMALNGYSLLDEGGNWKTEAMLDMYAYDAGTDSGTDYTSDNSITNPFQPVSLITGVPFNGQKIGTLTIALNAVLEVDDFTPLNKVNIYPNPVSNGRIVIHNLEAISFAKIELFNISGSLLKSSEVIVQANTLTLDAQNLASGIYLLRLTAENNQTIIRKLVME